jgi:tight adherence protein B
MDPIIAVMVFLATVLAIEGVYLVVQGKRRSDPTRARSRLRALAGHLQAEVGDSSGPSSLIRELGAKRKSFLDLVVRKMPKRETIELLLYRAGSQMSVQRFLLLSAVLAGAGWIASSTLLRDVLLGVVALLAGFLPWLVLARVASKRMQLFEDQFPEALELLTRAMRAGHSLGVGLQLVGEEMPDPVGPEFAQVSEEIKFGLDVRQALANMAHRIDTPDLPYFVAAVLIQRETGGNLAELLERLGTLVRDRTKFHGKLRALTSQGRLSALVLALWPGITVGMLIVIHPTYVAPMLEDPRGHVALMVSAVLVAGGYLMARRLATVEV